jgi:hypothetical protein
MYKLHFNNYFFFRFLFHYFILKYLYTFIFAFINIINIIHLMIMHCLNFKFLFFYLFIITSHFKILISKNFNFH